MPTREPTDDELRAAWQRLQQRYGWATAQPSADGFASLREAGRRWAQVRLEALHPAQIRSPQQVIDEARQADARAPAHAAATPPASRTPTPRPAQAYDPRTDRKRAAAGDRDDD